MTPTVSAVRRRAAGVLATVVVVVWAWSALPAAAFEAGRAATSVQPPPAATATAPAAEPGETPGETPAARTAGDAIAADAPAARGDRAGQDAPKAEQGEGEAEHGESVWAVVGRLFNFALLAAGLVYLLRSPLMAYLEQRGFDVRIELTRAAELRAEAGSQLSRIDARMKALPDEIETLKRRGAEEMAAEEARIRALAEAERQRLLDQARRGIETEVRLAERELKARAGELAVAVATERVKRTITDSDQARLVGRYVDQVRN
jgi:F0F1-type ATP synthase membrane subunit b/b'